MTKQLAKQRNRIFDGPKARRLRERIGWSRAIVAAKLADIGATIAVYKPNAIAAWEKEPHERGYANPKLPAFFAMCALYDVGLEELTKEEEASSNLVPTSEK